MNEAYAVRRNFPFMHYLRWYPFQVANEASKRMPVPPSDMTGVLLDALTDDPRNIWLWWNLTVNQELMGNRQGRRAALESAAQIAPLNPTIHTALELVRKDDDSAH